MVPLRLPLLAATACAMLFFSMGEALACRCMDSTVEEQKSRADLIVKGRMKSVTYGVEVPTGNGDGEMSRIARGDFEIEELLKGSFDGKIIQIHTGTGLGDCGRLEEFLQAALFYTEKDFAPLELGLTKTDYEGETYYSSLICDYANRTDTDDAQLDEITPALEWGQDRALKAAGLFVRGLFLCCGFSPVA